MHDPLYIWDYGVPRGACSKLHAHAAMAVIRLLPLFLLIAVASGAYNSSGQPPISRRSFPDGSIFGMASAAYQVVQRRGAKDRASGTLSLISTQIKLLIEAMGMWPWIPTISTKKMCAS